MTLKSDAGCETLLLRSRRFAEAEAPLRSGLRLDPYAFLCHRELGELERATGRTAEAIRGTGMGCAILSRSRCEDLRFLGAGVPVRRKQNESRGSAGERTAALSRRFAAARLQPKVVFGQAWLSARMGMVTLGEVAVSEAASMWQRPSKIPPGSITRQGE